MALSLRVGVVATVATTALALLAGCGGGPCAQGDYAKCDGNKVSLCECSIRGPTTLTLLRAARLTIVTRFVERRNHLSRHLQYHNQLCGRMH